MALRIALGGYELWMTGYRQIAVGKASTSKKGNTTYSNTHYFNDMKQALKYLEATLVLEEDIKTVDEWEAAHRRVMAAVDEWAEQVDMPSLPILHAGGAR
ncbi:hypothetical protein ACFQ41_04765 [Lacticaseibacillus suilingensis]|uniref:Uncharacterized protein n=1 Tax=Lacticaseibacillus suilingensis TaxID=2799577 RepID=A0ABW4BF88_9LACO|nr:hypothetical protein [Lacticaseibacillus suilingensis]